MHMYKSWWWHLFSCFFSLFLALFGILFYQKKKKKIFWNQFQSSFPLYILATHQNMYQYLQKLLSYESVEVFFSQEDFLYLIPYRNKHLTLSYLIN